MNLKKMKKIIKLMVFIIVFSFSSITYAADNYMTNIMLGGDSNGAVGGNGIITGTKGNVPKLSLAGLVSWIADILNQLIYVIVGLSLVVFLYGIFRLSFVDGHKPESREQSRKFMVWGIFSLFVMVSVWGLVNILQSTFFGSGGLIIPQLK